MTFPRGAINEWGVRVTYVSYGDQDALLSNYASVFDARPSDPKDPIIA